MTMRSVCWMLLISASKSLSHGRTGPWKDPRIHNLGNHGKGGWLHAQMAGPFTHMLDQVAYGGVDVREMVRESAPPGTVDLGCGVGLSTPDDGIGVDASSQMLDVATRTRTGCTFYRGLAERWGAADSAPLVIVSFLLHEQPRERRVRILHNARRISTGRVLVLDVHPEYRPSRAMLSGEPFLLDFLSHIEGEMADAFGRTQTDDIVPGRVRLWNASVASGDAESTSPDLPPCPLLNRALSIPAAKRDASSPSAKPSPLLQTMTQRQRRMGRSRHTN